MNSFALLALLIASVRGFGSFPSACNDDTCDILALYCDASTIYQIYNYADEASCQADLDGYIAGGYCIELNGVDGCVTDCGMEIMMYTVNGFSDCASCSQAVWGA